VLTVFVVLGGGLLGGCGQMAPGPASGSQTPTPPPGATAAHAWAVGERGTILATTDGGRNWSRQRSGTKKTLDGVAFADAQHGWIVGHPSGDTPGGLILATTDGGVHWQMQVSDPVMQFESLVCVDARHAWVVGVNGRTSRHVSVLSTTDGGAHWTTQQSSVGPREVAFADSRRGWLLPVGGADEGTIYATTDGGAHWAQEWTPPGDDPGDLVARGLVCSDARHCWATSSTWTFPGPVSSSVGIESPATVWATSDGGATWGALALPQGVQIREMGATCPVGLEGVAIAYQCSVLVQAGSGEWIGHKFKYAISDVAFSDASRGWLATWDGGILTTTDGGNHWVKRTRSKETIWALACPRNGE
jgi:photosystem II stability/assembly factor-like uncharacterized protein